ncbi:TetR/AcrR family transcriptional regulator [Saccharothrix yanglingensis]|uniref:TetR family transcriptional regulator n=1 Tax=Saccharothrix yanglingensis TaxID=659496 RepID=A0ABU0X4J3_9PSEU|nr:TetR/AcrR family transcriptional regulator [Saccharothrix yanglingensis]MDQ2587030.1 TetR family transcriptional regulator [Saccharothrix yanglingensis]
MAQTAGTDVPPKGRPVRERILAAADEHFYAEGIRAVSADRLIAEAGVSKVTFYRHFPTKDDLVLAYVERKAAVERGVLEEFRERSADACDTLVAIGRGISDMSCSPGFRGCPFINAAAEYADPDHPVRRAIAAHRVWFAEYLGELLGELGVADRAAAVEQLIFLRDGAMLAGYLSLDRADRAESIVRAGRAVVEAARTDALT